MSMTCETCKAYDDKTGTCRKRPPTAINDRVNDFAMVTRDAWCEEYKLDVNKQPQKN